MKKNKSPSISKYDFISSSQYRDVKFLVCPRCSEQLMRFDIEEFLMCPYCGYKFELSGDLEEFMLMPLVNEWERRQHNS